MFFNPLMMQMPGEFTPTTEHAMQVIDRIDHVRQRQYPRRREQVVQRREGDAGDVDGAVLHQRQGVRFAPELPRVIQPQAQLAAAVEFDALGDQLKTQREALKGILAAAPSAAPTDTSPRAMRS